MSVLFKLAGIGCLLFAFLFAQQIIEARGTRSELDYAAIGFPELYTMQLMLAIFVPSTVGVIAFGASFLLDIWVLLRELKPKSDNNAFLGLISR
jgi:hypothetical protein